MVVIQIRPERIEPLKVSILRKGRSQTSFPLFWQLWERERKTGWTEMMLYLLQNLNDLFPFFFFLYVAAKRLRPS